MQEFARLLPNYEVLSLIGRGGMGAVYLALQTALDARLRSSSCVFALPSQQPRCGPRVDAVVLKAMQQQPAQRYQSTTDMNRVLPLAAHETSAHLGSRAFEESAPRR